MGRREVVPELVVRRVVLLERERVQVDPRLLHEQLQNESRVLPDDTEPPATLVDRLAGCCGYRLENPLRTEADIREPLCALDAHTEHHVRSCSDDRRADAHAGGEPRHREPQLVEHGGEERILLEAVAAAPTCHQLCLEAREVEQDRPAKLDVEVLEGDRGEVGAVQCPQRVDPGQAVARVPEPIEVGLEIHVEMLPVSPRCRHFSAIRPVQHAARLQIILQSHRLATAAGRRARIDPGRFSPARRGTSESAARGRCSTPPGRYLRAAHGQSTPYATSDASTEATVIKASSRAYTGEPPFESFSWQFPGRGL